MSLLPDGIGGGSRCDNGKCLWDDSICEDFQGQCAIKIEEVKDKCGNWEECKGVVCREDYKLNGVNVCLARSSINPNPAAVTDGMMAIAKNKEDWTGLLQDFGDSMSLLQGGAGGGSRCDNGKCLWDDSICENFQGQCAIPIEEVKDKCGNWEECKGVVCRKDYVLNGKNVCLARSSIDPDAVIPGMLAIAKTPEEPSCQGEKACEQNIGTIKEGACLGASACTINDSRINQDETTIEAHACQGDYMCSDNEKYIGSEACQGTGGCAQNRGNIGAGACHGEGVCKYNRGTIGDGACQVDFGCFSNIGIIDAGCCIMGTNYHWACDQNKGHISCQIDDSGIWTVDVTCPEDIGNAKCKEGKYTEKDIV